MSWASLSRSTRAIDCSQVAQSSLARMNLQRLLKKLMKTEEAPATELEQAEDIKALASAIEKLPGKEPTNTRALLSGGDEP